MQGRSPQSIVFELSNPTTAADEQAIHDWHASVRIPAATGGALTHATRFVNASTRGGDRQPRLLTLFESDARDVEAAWEELGSHATALHPRERLVHRWFVGAMRTPLPAPESGRSTRGLLIGVTDPSSDADVETFDRFYNDVHAAETVASPHYWSAQRYRRIDAQGGPCEYVALYQSVGTEPETFDRFYAETAISPLIPEFVIRHVWKFNLVDTQDS